MLSRTFGEGELRLPSLLPAAAGRQYAEVRVLDAICCINRLRGVHFVGWAKEAPKG